MADTEQAMIQAAHADLKAELEGIKARHEAVLKELPADEEHCGCAVVLSEEVKRLKAKLEAAEQEKEAYEAEWLKEQTMHNRAADKCICLEAQKALCKRQLEEAKQRIAELEGK